MHYQSSWDMDTEENEVVNEVRLQLIFGSRYEEVQIWNDMLSRDCRAVCYPRTTDYSVPTLENDLVRKIICNI